MPDLWGVSAERANQLNADPQQVRFARIVRPLSGDLGPLSGLGISVLVIEWDFAAANLSDEALSEIVETWLGSLQHVLQSLQEQKS